MKTHLAHLAHLKHKIDLSVIWEHRQNEQAGVSSYEDLVMITALIQPVIPGQKIQEVDLILPDPAQLPNNLQEWPTSASTNRRRKNNPSKESKAKIALCALWHLIIPKCTLLEQLLQL